MYRTMLSRVLLAAVVMTAALAGSASAQTSPVGDWEGTLSAAGQEFPLVFHVTAGDEGALSTAIDSPSQGAFGIAGDETTFTEGTFTVTFPAIQGSFEATMSEDGDTLSGTWSQGGMSLPLELTRAEG